MDPKLQSHLDRIGVTDLSDPQSVWMLLHADLGDRAHLIHRYELEAASRGITLEHLTDEDRRRMRGEVLPVLLPGFKEQGGVTQPDPIVVVGYDPAWAQRYAEIESCLREALQDIDVVIEHMGSTAVPDLVAKPVIDIMVGVPDVEDEAAYVAAIEQCGVSLRSSDEGHRYFRPLSPLPRTVQVHVVDTGSAWHRRHLLFRDYLRAHPEAASAYGDLKKRMAEMHRTDRLAYNAAKTDFILDHLELAEQWARGT